MSQAQARVAMPLDRGVADQIPMVTDSSAWSLMPQNAGQAMEMAKLMSMARVGVPQHLRNEPATCLRVIMDAVQFGLNPFRMAEESSVINDRLGYSAKAIYAMVTASGALDGDLDLAWHGQGEALTCTVTGRLRASGKVRGKTCKLATIKTRNSPLWKADPPQQLGYFTIRAWCRLYAPAAIMGLVCSEDPQIVAVETPQPVEGPVSDLEKVEIHLGADATDAEFETVEAPALPSEPAFNEAATLKTIQDNIAGAASHAELDYYLNNAAKALMRCGKASRDLVDRVAADKRKALG